MASNDWAVRGDLMSAEPVDVAAIRAALAKATPGPWDAIWSSYLTRSADVHLLLLLRNNAEALLDALERAQAASAGVDMLVAQAERRGAVKALRAAANDIESWEQAEEHVDGAWICERRADAIEDGN